MTNTYVSRMMDDDRTRSGGVETGSMDRVYEDNVTDAVAREAVIIEEKLAVQLTDAEVLEFSRRAAQAYQKLVQANLEKKMAMSDYKAQVEEIQVNINHLQGIVASGIEFRDIQCEKVTHSDIGSVTITRLDTGHLIETRPMTPKERQMAMEL
jgi:chromosome condensin MukBEF ATPase and DNA-binding subunit MukB